MQTNDNSLIEKTDITRINRITNDIQKLQEFIDAMEQQKEHKIKALYIVNENNYQIELRGNFSNAASRKLLDLVTESRTDLVKKLEIVLNQCFELVKQSKS
jgi:hypothetical protein